MLPDSDPAARICIIVLPILLTFLLNLACAAAIYLDDAQLADAAAADKKPAKRLARLLANSDRTRSAVKLCSYVSVVLSTMGVLSLLPAVPVWAFILTVIIFPVLFNAVCIVSPRRIAAYSPEKSAYGLCGLLRAWCALTSPATALVRGVSSLFVRISGNNPNEAPTQVTEEEIRMLVDEGEESGAIDTDEKKMINNIFEFDDRGVAEVMTHRTEVSAVPVTATLHEAVELAMQSGKTRLPVYEDDIDTICGILYAKDLLQFLEKPQDFSLRSVMREPLYVPETCSCSDVFEHMQRKKTQIAVVVDEYGGTYGIVTMEDLLETIVGSIEDEYDSDDGEVTRLDDGTWLLDASMGLSEVENLFDILFPDESEADTIGGYLAEQLGYDRSADAPRSVVVDDMRFSVAQADDRGLRTVRAEKISAPDEKPES